VNCRNAVLTGAEVRNKVAEELQEAGIFEDAAYSFTEEVKLASTGADEDALDGGDDRADGEPANK
jgi:hypothetical protein